MLRALLGRRHGVVAPSLSGRSGGHRLEVEEFSQLAAISEVRPRWLSLLDSCGCDVPFLRPEWYECALQTIDRDLSPRLLFFSRNGEDLALAPCVLVSEQHLGLSFKRLTFVNNGYTPFQVIPSIEGFPSILEDLVAYAGRTHGPRCFLDLNELRVADDLSQGISNLVVWQKVLVRTILSSETRYLRLGGTFEAKLAGLDRKTQHEFRRKLRKIGTLGNVQLIRIDDPRDVHAELGRFFQFYERTWKGAEPSPEFYRRVCEEFGRLKRLHFYGLAVGDRMAAYVICLRGGPVMFGLKTTYDPDLQAYSPGVILFYRVIEDLYRTPGLEEFDIGRGNEQYKREWTSLTHQQLRLFVEPRSAMWRMIGGAKRLRDLAKSAQERWRMTPGSPRQAARRP